MDDKNIKTQIKKGIIELCILSVLYNAQAYPNEILASFKKFDFDIPEGTLYPALTRLKDAGYLSYKWVESKEGPPRKYFSITAKGKKYHKVIFESWDETIKSIKSLVKSHINKKA